MEVDEVDTLNGQLVEMNNCGSKIHGLGCVYDRSYCHYDFLCS